MFRSDNAGLGVENPEWNKNIHIIGQGNVVLKGADNPRATGDGARKLTLDPLEERKKEIGVLAMEVTLHIRIANRRVIGEIS